MKTGRSDDSFVEDEGWHLAADNPKEVYACVNYGEAACPQEIERQSICLDSDIRKVIDDILQ